MKYFLESIKSFKDVNIDVNGFQQNVVASEIISMVNHKLEKCRADGMYPISVRAYLTEPGRIEMAVYACKNGTPDWVMQEMSEGHPCVEVSDDESDSANEEEGKAV